MMNPKYMPAVVPTTFRTWVSFIHLLNGLLLNLLPSVLVTKVLCHFATIAIYEKNLLKKDVEKDFFLLI